MTTQEKAQTVAVAARKFASVLHSEGDNFQAKLFREMAECSPKGLAAVYDGLTAR